MRCRFWSLYSFFFDLRTNIFGVFDYDSECQDDTTDDMSDIILTDRYSHDRESIRKLHVFQLT